MAHASHAKDHKKNLEMDKSSSWQNISGSDNDKAEVDYATIKGDISRYCQYYTTWQ